MSSEKRAADALEFIVQFFCAILLVLASVFLAVALFGDVRAATLTDEEKTSCSAEGGCVMLTAARMKAELQKAYDAGAVQGEKKCLKSSI